MAFSSMAFLFGFLPAAVLCYYLIPARYRAGRNGVLLLFSLAFYAWGGLRLLPVLLAVLIIFYIAGCMIQKNVVSFMDQIREREAAAMAAMEEEAAKDEISVEEKEGREEDEA